MRPHHLAVLLCHSTPASDQGIVIRSTASREAKRKQIGSRSHWHHRLAEKHLTTSGALAKMAQCALVASRALSSGIAVRSNAPASQRNPSPFFTHSPCIAEKFVGFHKHLAAFAQRKEARADVRRSLAAGPLRQSQRGGALAAAASAENGAKYDYDLVIIGAGVGGHGAALHAVEKVRVALGHIPRET